jgi:O-succinylbenzoate synthase
VRLTGVELLVLPLAFRRSVGTAAGAHTVRPLGVVRVVTTEAEGWGECAALADGTAVDPGLPAVWDALWRVAAPRLVAAAAARGGELPPAWAVARLFGSGPVDRLAGAALEMAVLDAELRAEGTPLWRRLGATRSPVEAGALVGIPDDRDPETLLAEVDGLVADGYRRVRVKIGPGWDVVPLGTLRRRHPALVLQADANGAYRSGAAGAAGTDALRRLDGLGLACLEQPLAPPDLVGHAALAATMATPIGLDESLTSPERVRDALRYGACAVACLKPARLGGLLAARRAAQACAEAGVGAFVGGFFEAGLGRLANAALGALASFDRPGDLSPPDSYLGEDPFGYPVVHQGLVELSEDPGVGPPLPARWRAAATERRWLGAR